MSIPLCLTITHLLVHPPLRRSMLRDAGNALRPPARLPDHGFLHEGHPRGHRCIPAGGQPLRMVPQSHAARGWRRMAAGGPRSPQNCTGHHHARGPWGGWQYQRGESGPLWGSINFPIVWMEKTGATSSTPRPISQRWERCRISLMLLWKNTTIKTKFILFKDKIIIYFIIYLIFSTGFQTKVS